MELLNTIFDDVLLLQLPHFSDRRGDFIKVFHDDALLAHFTIKQINLVRNPYPFTLRGMHYQQNEFAESKFFRTLNHEAQIAFIDLRKTSRTFLHASSVILDKNQAVYIPKGYATGYLTLKANTDILYCSDNIYMPDKENCIRWNDSKFRIEWQGSPQLISEKDKNAADWK